jgi:tRNA-dihydrouridine synthase
LKGETIACREFRQHASYYLKGIPRSAKAKLAINQTEDKQVIADLLDQLVEKTEAREKIS